MAESGNQNVEEQPAEDFGSKIMNLKRQKANAKSALTKQKNKLIDLVESELPSRKSVRQSIDKVCSLQCKAVDVIAELAHVYKKAGELALANKTNIELDEVVETTEDTVELAQVFLKNTLDTGSEKSVISGIGHLYSIKSNASEGGAVGSGAADAINAADAHVSEHAQNNFPTHPTNTPLTPVKQPTSIKGVSFSNTSQNHIGNDLWKQLKRVSISTFSGDIKEYDGWKAAFLACVDNAPATNEYKLLQLKQSLAGEASQLVSKLGHSAMAYDIALERLERKYGGKRRQIALKMEEISNFKPLRPGFAKDLDKFADMLDVAVASLQESDKVEELGDGCLYSLLLKKLTEGMITQYKRWVYEQQRQESVIALREWVLLESDFHTVASEAKYGLSKSDARYRQKSESFFGAPEAIQLCTICQSQHHKVWQCKDFKSLPVSQRWQKAKQFNLCFRCLSAEHHGKFCTRSEKCGIENCQSTHNKLLHSSKPKTPHGSTSHSLPNTGHHTKCQGNVQQTTMSTNKQQNHFSALRTIPVVLKNGNRKIVVNALLDDASTQTYINEDVASELGLQGRPESVSVNVLNSKTETFDSMSVSFRLESLDGTVDVNMVALTTTKVTGNMRVIDWQKYSKRWSHLRDISFPNVGPRPIVDILIGMDYLELHCSQGDICGKPGDPVARLTPLGWTCVGSVSGQTMNQKLGTYFVGGIDSNANTDNDLDVLLQRFWETETISSSKSVRSENDTLAINAVDSSLTYSNGRYKVGIPWKNTSADLSDNYDMAYSRLLSTEKKLAKDQDISKAYTDTIEQYICKGYIRKVPENEKQSKWYLPHFPVVKLDRTTTKVRIVFDASAKCKGLSLNDTIHHGPKMQNELFEILIRFRKHPVAIICDVAEMYLQIEISEKDRSYFRFLWRSMDQTVQPSVYEFSRVVFGMNCSPFLAQYISQEHARAHARDYPLAADTIQNSTYMDDNMDSVETDSKAIELYEQLNALWSSAGMHARKWVSNSHQVLEHIPIGDRLKEINIHMSELPSVKALGLSWNAENDEFCFHYEVQSKGFLMTKRNFLSETARLFDPLGLLSPFIIRAKILLQEIWTSGSDWDEVIAPHLQQKAWQWYHEIENLTIIHIPRCIQFHCDSSKTNLHVFVDASEAAFGAVIYAATEHTGCTSSNLVASKSHVAPLKAISIPRMELLAAVLGVKLLRVVAKALSIPQHTAIIWSDSQNVLWWVKSPSRSFKSFVANRVGYIQENTYPQQWRYVNTQQNVADILSRGAKVEELCTSYWLNGPEFLLCGESQWPKQVVDFSQSKKLEKKKVKPQVDVSMFVDLHDASWRLEPSRFSDWKRLCRILAWVYRFLQNCQILTSLRKKSSLDVEEIEDAEAKLLLETQKSAFPKEYSALATGKSVPNTSKIAPLCPVLDANGLLRSSGRLKFADVISPSARCPIILPRRHWITMLIVKFYHENAKHMGTNSTLAAISSRFWIVSAREEIRDWEKECAWCRRQKAKPSHQLMADLPAVRVTCSLRAFNQVGVDFAGPFLTVQGRGKSRLKRYLCLFTCLSTRAVHLEMAFGLDTDSFLNAFFRMTHRRGMPITVISDNGTNFVGATKELKTLVSGLNSTRIMSTLANKGIHWQFNPPSAPHFGGVFEALIKSAKRAIFSILTNGDVTDEELMTAFTGAEDLINSRPQTYQSSHPKDETPLTPNHFLHGQLGGAFAPEIDETFNPRRRWRRIQELLRHIWKRWMQEWLPTLNIRKKWFSPTRDVRVDDVVVVVSPDTPRGCWPLGRIIKTHPGQDGYVRVVTLQMGKTILTRPVTKICPLEWNSSD